jgi:hypothetical protein
MVRGLPRRLLAALGLSLCVLSAVPGVASAQQAQIDQATMTSITSLNSSQTAQIEAYVREPLADLASEDPELVGQARNRLIDPLETRDIGVPFRLAYSNALCPELERLATSENELTAINALRVLAEIATDRSSLAVEGAVDNPGVGVRYTAVYALGRIFDTVAREAPAVAPQRVSAMMDKAGETIRNEEDHWVLDAAVRALVAAGSIDKDNFRDTRDRAYQTLADAVAGRIHTFATDEGGPERVQFMLRAAVALRDALTDTRALSRPAATAAAAMGGETLAYLAERVQVGGDLAPEEREVLQSISRTTQAAIHFAGTAAGASNPAPTPLPDLRGTPTDPGANDDAFIRAVVAEITRLEDTGNRFGFRRGQFTRP